MPRQRPATDRIGPGLRDGRNLRQLVGMEADGIGDAGGGRQDSNVDRPRRRGGVLLLMLLMMQILLMMPMLLLWPPRGDRIASSSDVVAVHGRRLGGGGRVGGECVP